MTEFKNNNKKPYFFKYDKKYYPLNPQEINWVFAKGDYCHFNTDNRPHEFELRVSISKLKAYLGEEFFLQPHRNYLINLNKIDTYDPLESLIHIQQQAIPVSKRYKKILEEQLRFLP